MNQAPSSIEHRRSHRAIADHFAGRASRAGEQAMRAHLPTCSSCTHRYGRHLILARLDPRGLPAERRIARALGLRSSAGPRRGRWIAALAIPAVAVLALLPRHLHKTDPDRGFAARGAETSAAPPPSFWAYRVGPVGVPELVDRTIGTGDELAFAYSNAAGRPFLMIFGVDEHRHVYWFHPAWPEGRSAPSSLRSAIGPGPYELPDAIHHQIDGRVLNVYAVFSDRAMDVTTVEAQVRSAKDGDPFRALGDGVVIARRTFQVRP